MSRTGPPLRVGQATPLRVGQARLYESDRPRLFESDSLRFSNGSEYELTKVPLAEARILTSRLGCSRNPTVPLVLDLGRALYGMVAGVTVPVLSIWVLERRRVGVE